MTQRYLPTVIQIVATLIITRMILPSDYGEVALVTSFNQIATLFVSAGFGEALMFRGNNTGKQYSSIFFFNLLIALFIYFLFFITSPFIAQYYEIPRLSLLCKVLFINIILFSLSYIQRIHYQIDLQFKPLAFISLVAAIVGSTVGITMAYKGMSIWSIVVLTLSINFVETILLWMKSKWHPSKWFSFQDVKELFPYSMKLLLNSCIQTIYDNIYSLVIGKSLGSKPLGFFNRMQTVVYFTTTNYMYSIESAFFPLICKNKEEDSHVKASYEKLLRVSFMSAIFILLLLILFAKQIVVLILTEKWIEGVPVLRDVAIGFLFVPISYINNSFLKIKNKPKVLLYSNIIKKAIGFTILAITVAKHDLHFICLGFIAYYVIDAIISSLCVKIFLNYNISFQIKCILNTIIIGLISSSLALFTSNFILSLFLSLLVGAVVLFVTFLLLNILFNTEELRLVKDILRGLKKG